MLPIVLPVDEAGTPCPSARDQQHLLFVARRALQQCVEEPAAKALHVEGNLRTLPLFVTLWAQGGQLRGCVGHVFPHCATLEEEVADCARGAALSDSRFEPMQAGELKGLTLDVTLMGPLQPVDEAHPLDPSHFGVLVEGAAGRRGVLLPNVEGVDTAAVQLRVARRKAGLSDGDAVTLWRFRVCKFGEE
jgi:AMMECR1 domain-containing protein